MAENNNLGDGRTLPSINPLEGQENNFSSDNSDFSDSDQSDESGHVDRYESVRVPRNQRTRGSDPTVVPARPDDFSTFTLSSTPQRSALPRGDSDRELDDNRFEFVSGEAEPVVHPKVKNRAKKALQNISVPKKKTKKEKRSCLPKCACCTRVPKTNKSAEPPATELTPELAKASSEGLNMMKQIMFPSLPAILQDLWVSAELFITLLAFGLGLNGLFPITENYEYEIIYFSLTVISVIFALIDAFFYFFQQGSCAKYYQFCTKKNSGEDSEDSEEDEAPCKTTCLSKNTLQKFNTWFELVRNLVSEGILYPIIIFDMFDFIAESTYDPNTGEDRANYSLFLIGSFYLILAVYIMRLFMVGGSMLSLIRLPVNKKATGDDGSTPLIIRFCLHIIGQILVHLMAILVIGTKINNENNVSSSNSSMTDIEDDSKILRASPFLFVSIFLGWILPLAGIVIFFVVNYYWMSEFSIGIWLNMLSLLQGEGFAETVFGGEGTSAAKDKALEFIQESEYETVKKQFKKYKSPYWWTKFFFPMKIPLAALCGLIYDLLLITFIVSLMFTVRDGEVALVVFKDDVILTSAFVISLTVILVANIHILLLLNSLLLVLFILAAIVSGLIVFVIIPLGTFVYFPLIGIIGYVILFSRFCCPTKNLYIEKDNYYTPVGVITNQSTSFNGSLDNDLKMDQMKET